jgi:hypothetical protein
VLLVLVVEFEVEWPLEPDRPLPAPEREQVVLPAPLADG